MSSYSSSTSKRLRIDKWLKHHLQQGDLNGLQWIGQPEDGLFAMSWSHKASHTWSVASTKNNVFLAYNTYRFGNRNHGNSPPDYKQLKQNLRSALRGSQHIRYEKQLSRSTGIEARRIYRFVAEPRVNRGSSCSSCTTDSELPQLDVDADLSFLETMTLQPDGGSTSCPSPSAPVSASSSVSTDTTPMTQYDLQLGGQVFELTDHMEEYDPVFNEDILQLVQGASLDSSDLGMDPVHG